MLIVLFMIFVFSIYCLTFYYSELAECEEERQVLIASIEKLKTKKKPAHP